MSEYKFIGDHIEIEPPKKPKKLTATRLANVLGLNRWSTPFETWCAITRTYEEPFTDNIYTNAGKVIEPKVIQYLNDVMFMDVKSPTDVYGADYFKKTRGDFFPESPILGGMWDCIGDDFIVEIKTTKRAEDWAEDVPIYYKLQAALYAWLLRFDTFYVTVSFLEDKDYANPEAFEPSYKNTKVYEFSLEKEFPFFADDYVAEAIDWWGKFVESGISPPFDEKADAEVLKALRTKTVDPDDAEIGKLIAEADRLQLAIDKAEAKLDDKKERVKEINELVKKYMTKQFRDGDKKVEIAGKKYNWTLTKSTRTTVDTKLLKEDGLYEDYSKTSESMTLKKQLIEEAN